MRRNNPTLHGQAPDHAKLALVFVDVINDFDFEDGELLLERALPAAQKLSDLKHRFVEAQLPVIYCNDNFDRWRSDFSDIVERCLDEDSRGHEFVKLLKPSEEDYAVLKPKESAFYETVLELLLNYLGVEALVICGVTADICVLFTANDAYVRDYDLYIPEDGVASVLPSHTEHALSYARRVLHAETTPTEDLNPAEIDNQLREAAES